MKSTIYCIFLLILSIIIGNKSLFVKANTDRIVRNTKFEKGKYYDVLEYEWDITPTQNVGIYEYFVSSNHTLCTLLMNSTDFYNWEHTYFKQWLINEEYNFEFLNNDLKSKMCMSPVTTCKKDNINFPYNKLYVVILRMPYEEPSYIVKDGIDTVNSSKSAKLIYDPLNPLLTINKESSIRSTTESAPPISSAMLSSFSGNNNQRSSKTNKNTNSNRSRIINYGKKH